MRRLAEQARARGVRLLGADTAANLRSGIWRMPADEFAELEFTEAAADTCRAFAAAHPEVRAVMTLKEAGVVPAALLADAFGVAGNSVEAARTIRTKDLCRTVLHAAGLDQPRFTVASGLAEATAFLADRDRAGTGPWIVKPRDGQGSAGVSLVRSAADLPTALARVDSGRPFLIEEFIEGDEFSAEGVMAGAALRVLTLTRKRTGAGFVETGHRTPAGLAPATDAAARAAVVRAVTAAGVTHGLVHAEFWVTAEGDVVLGEIHARPGGDFIHALVEHTLPGFEMFGALLDDLLGHPLPAIPPQRGAAGAEFIVLDSGRVQSVEGWEKATDQPALIAADLDVRPGDVLAAVGSSADRHGVFVAGAATPDEVEAVLAGARDSLRIEIGAL
jgi:biotin carboxylase